MNITEESILLSTSIVDLPIEELQKEYNNLKKSLLSAQQDLDSKNQQLYDYKRQLTTAQVLEKEYQQEIESLQTGENSQIEKLKGRIKQLEGEANDVKQDSNEQIQFLETELLVKSQEVEHLQIELKTLSLTISNNTTNDYDKIKDENSNLKSELETLRNNYDVLNEEHVHLQKLHVSLEENMAIINAEMENLKENVANKKDELQEANDLIQTLQDDLAMLRCQMEAIQSKPLDRETKGNSLFAEVDDRRLELQKNVRTMKTRYIEMKRECANYIRQISTLRAENVRLLQRWDSELKEREKDDNLILSSYKKRVKELEAQVANYEKLSTERQEGAEGLVKEWDITFVENMLNRKRKEIETLHEQLSRYSLNEMILSKELRNAHLEIRSLKLKTTQLEHEIGNLRDTMHQTAVQNSLDVILSKEEEIMDINFECDIDGVADATKDLDKTDIKEKYAHNIDFSRLSQRLKVGTEFDNFESVKSQFENKENEEVKIEKETVQGCRKVTFSESAKESTKEGRGPKRLGAKILQSKVINVRDLLKK